MRLSGALFSRFGSGGVVRRVQSGKGGNGSSRDCQCERVECVYWGERYLLAAAMPPKKTSSATVWAELEAYVKDNARRLADRHRLRAWTGPVKSTAQLLRNVFRTKPPLEHKFYMFLERILEKPDTLKPEQSARLDGIWQVVVRALVPMEVCSASASPTAKCHDSSDDA